MFADVAGPWRPTSRTLPTHYPSRVIFALNSYSFCDQENPYTSFCTYRWLLYGSAFLAVETHRLASVWILLVWDCLTIIALWLMGRTSATLIIQQFVVIWLLLFLCTVLYFVYLCTVQCAVKHCYNVSLCSLFYCTFMHIFADRNAYFLLYTEMYWTLYFVRCPVYSLHCIYVGVGGSYFNPNLHWAWGGV